MYGFRPALRTLYNHFAGRDELLAAAFGHYAAQTRAAVEAIVVPDAGPQEQLEHVVEAYHRRYAAMGDRLSVLLSLRGFPELHEQIRAIRGQRCRLLEEIVEHAERAGLLQLPATTAVALAYTLTSHAGWQALCEQADGNPAEATRIANDALRSALFHERIHARTRAETTRGRKTSGPLPDREHAGKSSPPESRNP